MRLLQIISSVSRSAGTSVFCVGLTDGLARQGQHVGLFTYQVDGQEGMAPQCSAVELAVNRSYRLPGLRTRLVFGANSSLDRFAEGLRPEVVHVHGLWNLVSHAGVTFARRRRLPLVVSPHGMTTPWALGHHAWRKRLAWRMYQWRDLRSADLLHATALSEVEDLRKLGLRQPIAIIPVGVEMVDPRAVGAGGGCATGPGGVRQRTLLFLSRVHPKKGLPNLIEAWKQVRLPNWRVVIAGPDEGGHLDEIRRLAQARGVGDDFVFTGAVYGESKAALYRSADLFVLPSYSENFGIVVPDALAYGIPVITTRATPWAELEAHRCGWWIDVGVEPLVAALREALSLGDAQRAEMGRRGRDLVAAQYSWPHAARQMSLAYEWMLGRGTPPACVQIG